MLLIEPSSYLDGCWLEDHADTNIHGLNTLQITWAKLGLDTPVSLELTIVEPCQLWSREHVYEDEEVIPSYMQTVGPGYIRVKLKSGRRQSYFTFGGSLTHDAATQMCTIQSKAPILHISDGDFTLVDMFAAESDAALARLTARCGMPTEQLIACLAKEYTSHALYLSALQSVLHRFAKQAQSQTERRLCSWALEERRLYSEHGQWDDASIVPLEALSVLC